jgi:hypothetical protein
MSKVPWRSAKAGAGMPVASLLHMVDSIIRKAKGKDGIANR